MAGQLALGETVMNVFNLSTKKGLIIAYKEVTLSPFEMWTVSSVSNVTGHARWMHVIAKPREQIFSNEVVATSTYSDLRPGSSRVKIYLQNLTSKKVTIPAQCVIGQIQAANEVPGMYSPVTLKGYLISHVAIPNDENWPSSEPTAGKEEGLIWFPAEAKPKALAPNQTILEQTDLSGCISWSPEDCKEATNLLLEFVDVFSQHDLDLGEILVVEHDVKLEPNLRPFHERFTQSPNPCMRRFGNISKRCWK